MDGLEDGTVLGHRIFGPTGTAEVAWPIWCWLYPPLALPDAYGRVRMRISRG